MISHDGIFKEFLQRFLPQFIEGFLPDVAQHLDLQTFKPVMQELVMNIPQQLMRRTDFVAEVMTKTGEPRLILTHIEVESELRRTFASRMFSYYAFLSLTKDEDILPIVFVLRGSPVGVAMQTYRRTLFGTEILTFNYHQIGLNKLNAADWHDINPVLSALTALMGFEGNKARQIKSAAVQNVNKSGLTEGDKQFLMKLIDDYLPADDIPNVGDSKMLVDLNELEKSEKFQRSWTEYFFEQGQLQGQLQGQVQSKQETLLEIVETCFEIVPKYVEKRIMQVDDMDVLSRLIRQVVLAERGGLGIEDVFPTEI